MCVFRTDTLHLLDRKDAASRTHYMYNSRRRESWSFGSTSVLVQYSSPLISMMLGICQPPAEALQGIVQVYNEIHHLSSGAVPLLRTMSLTSRSGECSVAAGRMEVEPRNEWCAFTYHAETESRVETQPVCNRKPKTVAEPLGSNQTSPSAYKNNTARDQNTIS